MTTAETVRRYARTPSTSDVLRRYAQPSDDHAGFLRHLEENPDDFAAYHAYADWHRDRGLDHTADFILRAANLGDTRPHNYRVRREWFKFHADAPAGAERMVYLTHGTRVDNPTPYSVSLWQKSPDGNHGLWNLHGLTPEEAQDWERRLASEGASLPLYRRHRGNPYRPKPRL